MGSSPFRTVPLSQLMLPMHPIIRSVLLGLALATMTSAQPAVLVEAEGFSNHGGWVIDQQSMDQMGSPYLLAHGLGEPVADATTLVRFERPGRYRLWVRTRDWTAPWKTPETHPDMRAEGSPGVFRVVVDGRELSTVFGKEGRAWHWQDGGVVDIPRQQVSVALRDLTGFAGRCDALLFVPADSAATPPDDGVALSTLRRQWSGQPEQPMDAGEYDLVVVGGGMAGCTTAVSAARLGSKVALIHDRPVLGGNNSSEVRVGLSGLIHQKPFSRLGNLVEEIGPTGHWSIHQAKEAPALPRSKEVMSTVEAHPEKKIHNAGPTENYEDERKLAVVRAEKNLTLHLLSRVNRVEMDGTRITAVVAQDLRTGELRRFRAKLFADCTGDGVLGALAGADFAYGREAQHEFGETAAPKERDELVMGTSVQWYADRGSSTTAFPDCPWALKFDAEHAIKTTRGDWDWETGFNRNHVTEIEEIRDYGLRVVFGNWSTLKNHPKFKDEFAQQKLKWVAYIGGKRESRRLLGDVILRQQDIVEAKPFPDASVTTTWTIDLHYPTKALCACDAFQSEARHIKITPYPIPYRCLYSRNIANLFMAGRNISVTHVALGTVRVQRTTGMMGEVLGMAASLCREFSTTPRGVYENHLPKLIALMEQGVGRNDLAVARGSYRAGSPAVAPEAGGGARAAAKAQPEIFLVLGQSNGWRLGRLESGSQRTDHRVYYFGMECETRPESARLQILDQLNPAAYGFGLTDSLIRQAGRDVVIIQYAVCGSSLQGAADWYPGDAPTEGRAHQNGLYGSFARYVSDARRQVEALGFEWKISGVFWHQGESDAGIAPAVHQRNLQNLFGRLRQDLGAGTPIVTAHIREVGDGARGVNRALDGIGASDPRVAVVASGDLPFDQKPTAAGALNPHFSAAGGRTLGERMAVALLRLKSTNASRSLP
jgi:FAD dependent oxidoreductase/Carbohydrate esterase, sialic acid-specific acetylesterase